MIPWQACLIVAGMLMPFLAIRSSLRRNHERKVRDATRKLELVLQPRETVKVICPQKKGRVILTSKRVLFETKTGFTAVAITSIKKVQGTNEKGNRTTIPAKMVQLAIKTEQEYVVKNDCGEFAEFAKLLAAKVKKQNEKKAKKP